jgi:hypothetical protein
MHFEASFPELHGILRRGEHNLPGPLPVTQRNLDPRFLSYVASCEEAGNVCQALPRHAQLHAARARRVAISSFLDLEEGPGRYCSPRHTRRMPLK